MLNGGQQLVGSPAYETLHPVQQKRRIGPELPPRLVHRDKGMSPRRFFLRGGEKYLAGHDQALRLFTAFREPLTEDQFVGPALAVCRGGKNRAGYIFFRHGILRSASYMAGKRSARRE